MALAVEILESCMVTPSEAATPKHGVWLSNLDLLVRPPSTCTLRTPTTGPDFFSPDALSKALVPFYPLAGRLAQDGAGRPEIHCTGDGVLFVTARADAALQDLGGFVPSDKLRRMLVPSASGGTGILAMFQVTFFKCGGVCVGAAIHHTAADGLAALDFVNTWAAIARGAPPRRPWLDRTLLRARSPPAVRFELRPRRRVLPAQRRRRVQGPVRLRSAVLPLSKAQVDALNQGGGKKKLSTFKAMVAHVWRCACAGRGLAAAEDTRLYMTADARFRVAPPLPDGYLGNAIFRASTVAKAGDVVSEPLGATADRISGATVRLDDGYVRSLLDYLEDVVGGGDGAAAGLRKGEWVMPETDLWVISWQGLPIYDADFGWGRPAFMCRACLQFSGLVYLVPGPNGDGRLDVVVGMEHESLARFKELLYEELKEQSVAPSS